MWLLKDSNGKTYYLKPDKPYNVGRKLADIILDNDLSISRCHAILEISLKEEVKKNDLLSTCIVKDDKSKYGTFVIRNGVQVRVTNQGHELLPNDSVKFGLQNYIFKVENIRFMTFMSKISEEHKNQLQEIIDRIGGIVVDDYNDNCTHLTVTTATPTNKILTALIAGIPIVNINYWVSLEKAIDSQKKLPNPQNFTVPLEDKSVNTQKVCLKPNPARKTLFQGNTFHFFSQKIYKMFKNIVIQAGGKAMLHKESEDDLDNLLASDSIVMLIPEKDDPNSSLYSFSNQISRKLKEKKLRMVNEIEIPLAIMYVSKEQYCNPKFQFKKLLQREPLPEDKSEILVLDTQDITPSTSNENKNLNSEERIIPESNNLSLSSSIQNFEPEKMPSQPKTTQLFKNFKDTKSKPNSKEKELIKNPFCKDGDKNLIPSAKDKNVDPLPNTWKNPEKTNTKTLPSKQTLFLTSKKRKVNHDSDDEISDDINCKNLFRKKQKKSLDHDDVESDEMNDEKKRESNKKIFNRLVNDESDEEISVPIRKVIKKKPAVEEKLQKLGFKKSNREVLDFDLDELDDVKPINFNSKSKDSLENAKCKNKSKNSPEKVKSKDISMNVPEKESQKKKVYSLEKNGESSSKRVKNDDDDDSYPNQPFDKPVLKKNKKSWLLPEVSENKSTINIKNEKLPLLRDSINLKCFKKVPCLIPSVRISLQQELKLKN